MNRYWMALVVAAVGLAQDQTPTVLRFDVNLVQIDAVVTDRKGRHVADLRPEDFEVLQDGVPQKLIHFEYVSHGSGSPGVPQSVVLLLDDRDVAFEDFAAAQSALRRYVKELAGSGVLAAIVRTSGGSATMEQFSSDPAYLTSVVDHLLWRPAPRTFVVNPLAWVGESIRGLAGHPGRKSVIWISPGINTRIDQPFIDALQSNIVDPANRASVTVQTIDIRGLPATFNDGPLPDASSSRSANSVLIANGFRGQFPPIDYFRSQGILTDAADMTGGLFQHDSNDLLRQLRAAVDDNNGYYLLGWYPGQDAFASKAGDRVPFHTLKIRLRRKGLAVRSRSGYFGVPNSTYLRQYFGSEAQLRDALFSPLRARQIGVQLASVFGGDGGGASIHSYVRIGPQGLVLTDPDAKGCSSVKVEIASSPLLLSWSAEPEIGIEHRRVDLQVCGASRKAVLEEGLGAEFNTRIDRAGSYQMRVAVRNLRGNESAGSLPEDGLIRRDSTTPDTIETGAADEVIAVPDWRKRPVVSGFVLRETAEPRPGREGNSILMTIPNDGDETVREFHQGQTIFYGFRVDAATSVRLHMVHEGKEIYTTEPMPVNPGKLAIGKVVIGSDWRPGSYLAGIESEAGGKRRPQDSSLIQWLPLTVIPTDAR